MLFNRDQAFKPASRPGAAPADCAGQLTDPARSKGGWGFCRVCRCAWQVAASDGHAYAATVPSAMHRETTGKPKTPGAPSALLAAGVGSDALRAKQPGKRTPIRKGDAKEKAKDAGIDATAGLLGAGLGLVVAGPPGALAG